MPSPGEDVANSISHGLGVVLILAATPFLLMAAADRGGVMAAVCAGVFAATVAVLYLASSLYHALPHGGAKRVLRAIDHCAIFLLIAGTYTPFTLGALRGPWGWTLFCAVWGLAAMGVGLEVLGGARRRRLSVGLYLTMGWLVVLASGPLVEQVPVHGLLLLLAGGVAYTVGIVFYALKWMPYAHLIWHLFVLTGTVFHFFAVMRYAA